MINPFLPNVDGESKKSQSETLINPFLPSKSSLSTSSTPRVNPFLPSVNPFLPSEGTGGRTGEDVMWPEGGRTFLNVIKSMPGTVEGFVKAGLQFGIATPYATVKAGIVSALKGELDAFPDAFNKVLENSANVNLLGVKPFAAQTDAGERFQHLFHESIIEPITGHFHNRAERAFAATNNAALATSIRTTGELISLLVPIYGIKGATAATKSMVDKIPAKPINIPGTDVGLPLGRKFYEDPKNIMDFKTFDTEYLNRLNEKGRGHEYNLEASQELYTYAMQNHVAKRGKKGEEILEDNIEITLEATESKVDPWETRLASPGEFISTFDRYVNPRTNKPYTERALEKYYKKYLDEVEKPEIGKYTKLSKSAAEIKFANLKELKEILRERKTSNKQLDPKITQEMAVKILETAKPAVRGEKDGRGRIFSALKGQSLVDAKWKAAEKGYLEPSIGISSRGVMSREKTFFSKFEEYQLMEKAQTGRLILESELAKKLKYEDSIFKDRQLLPEETVGMKITPESLKMMEESHKKTTESIAKEVAKGPKEVKTLAPKKTEGPLDIFDVTREMWREEGGWEGKFTSLGAKYIPDNTAELIQHIGDPTKGQYKPGDPLPPYRGLLTKQQGLVSKTIQGFAYKSITLMDRVRQISPTYAKVVDGFVAPSIHLAIFDSKGAARRPRSVDSVHTEKANRIGTFMTARLENNGFKGLNEIFHAIKPTYLPGVQQLVKFRGRIMSEKDGLKILRAIRGQGPAPKGKLGQVVKETKELIRRMDDYIKEVFPDHETIANYFPQAWNKKYIEKHQDQFIRDLTEFLETPKIRKEFEGKYGGYGPGGAFRLSEQMSMNIIGEGRTMASNRAEAMLSDIMNMTGKENVGEIKAIAKKASGVDHQRILRDLPVETFEKYMKNEPYEGLQYYIEETVNRVEWARMFGEHNELLYKGIIDGVREASAKGYDVPRYVVERTLRLAEAMQGAYKMGGHKGWIKTQRWTTNFLNAALLPLATVASLPEAALPLYNGGIKAYGKALSPAIGTAILSVGKAIHKDFKAFGIDRTRSMIISQQIRKAGDVAAMERINALFQGDSSMLGNIVFRANLLYYWTKWMNHLAVGTYDAMVKDYFKSKAAGKRTGLTKGEEVRMERLMEYYGLDLAEGIAWSKAKAPLKGPFFEKLKRGAHLFAEDSVLTPNPATLPLWHSNPNLGWLRHLKTFPTLIGNRVVAKWGNEIYKGFQDQGMPISGGRAGTYAIGTGMGILLTADLSNHIIDFLRYGDKGNPLYEQRFGERLSERQIRVLRAIERAGLLGMGNFVFDSMFHSYTGIVGIFMGPTVAKGDALFKALFAEGLAKQNPKSLARELVKITPALNVNKEIRDDAIIVLEEFLRENTFMDKGSKWRKVR